MKTIPRRTHQAPRLRASEYLADIIKVAQLAKDFMKGHRMKPAFRSRAYRELRLVRSAMRRFYSDATGQM